MLSTIIFFVIADNCYQQ